MVVFRLEGPSWEDSDDEADLRYVDHRKWDSQEHRDMSFSDMTEEKNLVELNDDHEVPHKDALFAQLKLKKSDSMTILPIFVSMDEQFYPDDPLEYYDYEGGYDEDYYDS